MAAIAGKQNHLKRTELIARVLHRQLDDGEPEDRLLPFALISTCSEAQIQRMLTVLIRAAERHRRIADLLTNPGDDEPTLECGGVLSRILRRIGKKRPQRPPAADRGCLLSRVPFNTDLGVVENALPRQNTYLLRVSAQLTRRLLDRLGLPNRIGNSAERARLLNNLGNRLSALGRREEALAATAEAVEIRRRLAGVNPAAFDPDLARGLWSFARVRAAGQVELPEALNAADESVRIYEQLVKRLPQAFAGDLRGALATLAEVFDALGRSDDAAHVRARLDARLAIKGS